MARIIYVCGPWGSGKSTALRNLAAAADEQGPLHVGFWCRFGEKRAAILWSETGGAGAASIVTLWQRGLNVVTDHPRDRLTYETLKRLGDLTGSVTAVALTTTPQECLDGIIERRKGSKRVLRPLPQIGRLEQYHARLNRFLATTPHVRARRENIVREIIGCLE